MKGNIDAEMIGRKIARIEAELHLLEKFKKLTFDEIAQNQVTHHTVERIIEIIVGAAIDINQHLIVALGKGELPFDFTKSFLIVSDLGIYPKDFGEQISKSVGLRNILVHEYEELDEKKFYASIKDCYRDYTKYCRYILEYLKKQES